MAGEHERRYPLSAYAIGSITKVELTNFLTYDHAFYFPSPNLNVIIGSNGTGKSSVLCGICLAVGGTPSLLGRSSRMSDYIKHGRSDGWVEVTLRDNCESQVKKFRISLRKSRDGERGDCSSEYFIDDEKVTHKNLNKVIDAYNVQIANPCTFLAQDKVKSFSEQNAQQLLDNTQRALGEGLHDKYTELVAESKEGKDVEKAKKQLERNLERVKNVIAELEPRVQAYHDRRDTNRHIIKLKECVAYLEAEAAFEEFTAEISGKKKKEDELQKKIRKSEKLREAITKCDEKVQQSRSEYRTQLTRINEIDDEITEMSRDRKLDDEIAENQRQFDATKRRFDNWDNEKMEVEANVASFRNNYTELRSRYEPQDLSHVKAELVRDGEEIRRRKQAARQREGQIHSKEQQINQQKQARVRVMRNKLQQLTNMRPLRHLNIRHAWEFYQSNRYQFRCPVYVPYLEIVLLEKSAPLYVCNTIGPRDMGIFIFGCPEDERLMHEQGFKINSTVMDERRVSQFSSRRPQLTDGMKRLHFKKFLYGMIDAPVEVMAYLMANNSIESIPIGTSELNNDIEDVAARIGDYHGLFYTPQFRVQVKFSQFSASRDPIVRIEQLSNQGNYFTEEHYHQFDGQDYTSSLEAIQREKESLQADAAVIAELIQAYSERNTAYNEAEKAEQRKKFELRNLQGQLEREEEKLRGLLDVRPDLENAQRALEERNNRCKQKALARTEKIMKAVESLVEKLVSLGEVAIVCREAEASIDEQREKESKLQSEIELLQDEVDGLRRQFARVERTFELCNERFTNACRLPSIDPSKLNSTQKKRLKELAEVFEKENIERDVEVLERKIDQEIARLNVAGVSGTEADVQRHQEALEEKEQRERELAAVSQEVERNIAQLDAKLGAWRDPVNELVSKISANFSKFFSQLNCTGEVKLNVPENEYHMEEYGIDIYVKFREKTNLRRLDDKSQSGGERSVSTMLYMLALQELCPVPFRCVDEINQGMDPRNERKVFEMMLDILASEGSLAKTQYFLLTPKLLHGLRYNDKVRVGIIFNSPTVIPDTKYKESIRSMLAGIESDEELEEN